MYYVYVCVHRWKDITNVINHKRHFGMECQNPEESAQFQLADVESAKYVWRMCVHQVIVSLINVLSKNNIALVEKSVPLCCFMSFK